MFCSGDHREEIAGPRPPALLPAGGVPSAGSPPVSTGFAPTSQRDKCSELLPPELQAPTSTTPGTVPPASSRALKSEVSVAGSPCSQTDRLQFLVGQGEAARGKWPRPPAKGPFSSCTDAGGCGQGQEPVLSPEGKLAGKLLEKISSTDKRGAVLPAPLLWPLQDSGQRAASAGLCQLPRRAAVHSRALCHGDKENLLRLLLVAEGSAPCGPGHPDATQWPALRSSLLPPGSVPLLPLFSSQ